VAIDTLDMLGSPKDARIIVLNRADAKVGLRPDDVVTAIKSRIAVNIPNSLSVPASVNRGVPVVLDDPRGPVTAAIRELTDVHIRQRFGDTMESSSQRKSLFKGRR
jgi:pilus assembly protein CpaE